MNINLRRVGDFAKVSLEEKYASVDYGLLDRDEVIALIKDFEHILEELEWFVHVTEK